MGDYRETDSPDMSSCTEGQAGHDSLYSNPIQQVIHLREKGDNNDEIEEFLREKYEEDRVFELMGMASMKQNISHLDWDFEPDSVFQHQDGDTMTAREIGYLSWKELRGAKRFEDGFAVNKELYRRIDEDVQISELKQELTQRGREVLEKTIDRKGEEWVLEHEELILAQAQKVGHLAENTLFTEEQGKQYESIIDFLSPPDGKPTSSAKIEQELEWEPSEIQQAVSDLLAFGELELINVSQYPRVRLHKSATPSSGEGGSDTSSEKSELTFDSLGNPSPSIWHAYITETSGTGRTRARRLFDNRQAAEQHLTEIVNEDSLVPVPGLSNVWCETTDSAYHDEYAVLRGEPIYSEATNPYP